MKRKKIVIGLLSLCIVAGGSAIAIKSVQNNKQASYKVSQLRAINDDDDAPVTGLAFSEVQLTLGQLINVSPYIVKGKVKDCLGEYTYSFDLNGETVDVEKRLYDFELSDTLKGTPENTMKITINSSEDPEKLWNAGQESVFLLHKIEGDYEDAYSLVSAQQSSWKIDGEQMTNQLGETAALTELDSLIHDVQDYQKGDLNDLDPELVEELEEDTYLK